MDYETMTGPNGQEDNMGGTRQYWYLGRKSDFATIATLGSATDLASLATISGNHSFNTGKCFYKGYCTINKGKIDDKQVGEEDGKSWKSEAELTIPGQAAQLLGFANLSKNDKFIVLIPLPDGTVRQLGTDPFPASIESDLTTATNESGLRAVTIKVKASGTNLLKYPGTIAITPAP